MTSLNDQLNESYENYKSCLKFHGIKRNVVRNQRILEKEVNTFEDTWPKSGCTWPLKLQLIQVAIEFACRYIDDTLEEYQRNNCTRLLHHYFEFGLTALKHIWYIQNDEDVLILNDIRDNGFMTNYVYHLLENRYQRLIDEVTNGITQNKQTCKIRGILSFQFELIESAQYHYYKHSVQDVYELRLKRDNILGDPDVYFVEANHTIALIEQDIIQTGHQWQTVRNSPKSRQYDLSYIIKENDNEYIQDHLRKIILFDKVPPKGRAESPELTNLQSYYKYLKKTKTT